MEARKNPKTDAQRDQYLAVCRHTHDNIIFNYGSVENYIVAKNTEINTAESKLQSYYDNPRKGKSRRPAIIAGLENTIFIMKNSLTNALRDLEELDAAQATETPQISTETAETVNVSAESENAEKTPVFSSREEVITYLDKTHGIEYDAGEVVYLKDGCCAEEHADGSEWCIYRNEDSAECVETVRIAPQSSETPQTVDCATDTLKPRETARKRPNRAICSAQHHQYSALGANGYAMLDNASATMAAMNARRDTLRNTLRSVTYVPRECSTTEAAYW